MPRVLVAQLARMGDLVQTKRLIRSLAPAQVHLAVDVSLEGLARRLYPEVQVHGIAAHAGGPRDAQAQAGMLLHNRNVFAELRGADFEAVYTLNHSGLSLALSRLFDPAIVRGHVSAGPQALKDPWTALAFRWIRQRGLLGINLVDLWAHLAPRPVDPASVNLPATPKGGGLGVVLAGRNARRSLPPQALALLVQVLSGRLGGAPVILLGTMAERPQARALLGAMKPQVAARTRDLCGRTSLDGLMDELAGLDLLLTPDTGSMHLAAHLGTPVEALFLSSAWAFETGPYGLGHTVWQAAAPCAPCLESADCGQAVACLRPFLDPAFQRLIAGRTDAQVAGIVGLHTDFDPLGAVCRPFHGLPVGQAERDRFRTFLQRHLCRGNAADHPADAAMAEALYQERDWLIAPPRTQALAHV